MKKHEIVYESYKRYHKGDNCLELEERKIGRETIAAKKATKEVSKKLEKLLDYENLDDEYIDDLDNSMYSEKIAKRTNKVHKKRLTNLKKNDDFK